MKTSYLPGTMFIGISLHCRLFCKVTAFIRKKLDMLFPSVKNPSSKVLSPGSGTDDHGGKLFDFDSSWAAAKCINSLLRSVVLSMDMK